MCCGGAAASGGKGGIGQHPGTSSILACPSIMFCFCAASLDQTKAWMFTRTIDALSEAVSDLYPLAQQLDKSAEFDAAAAGQDGVEFNLAVHWEFTKGLTKGLKEKWRPIESCHDVVHRLAVYFDVKHDSMPSSFVEFNKKYKCCCNAVVHTSLVQAVCKPPKDGKNPPLVLRTCRAGLDASRLQVAPSVGIVIQRKLDESLATLARKPK
jgi:hypothetical protein